jgi:hypothetical protein
MWLYILAFFLLIFGIVGSVLSGGIFTIVLIPLGIIALITAAVVGGFGHAAQRRHGASTDARASTVRPLPTGHSNVPSAPSGPEDLAEARRVQQ